MAIGYGRARNLMRQLDWKMRATVMMGSVNKIELYHPKRPATCTVRLDSGRKLMAECREIRRQDEFTTILCYDHDGSDESLI